MYAKFEKLLQKHDVTAYRVAKDTGITTATFTSWKQGKYTPKRDKMQKIADYFGVTLDYFTEQEDEETDAPEWASTKDMRDFKKMLEEDEPVMFDGVPMTTEDKEKVKRIMEALFWEAKDMNKKTYGRKKKEE
ncbi:hypothetical protein B2I21_09945 [Chryseobacterium mucoviscidosis]|nr:hypothetical protein B2I21_09945 [Chryseobacterium mucoviscidosis]